MLLGRRAEGLHFSVLNEKPFPVALWPQMLENATNAFDKDWIQHCDTVPNFEILDTVPERDMHTTNFCMFQKLYHQNSSGKMQFFLWSRTLKWVDASLQ